jgi:hypothetical protein
LQFQDTELSSADTHVKSDCQILVSSVVVTATAPRSGSGMSSISRRRLTSATGVTLSRILEVPCDGDGGDESTTINPSATAAAALVLNFASEDQLSQTLRWTLVDGMVMDGEIGTPYFCATNSKRREEEEETPTSIRRHSTTIGYDQQQSTEASSSSCYLLPSSSSGASRRPFTWPSPCRRVKAFACTLRAAAAFAVDHAERRPLLCAGVQCEPPIFWDDADVINVNVSNSSILLLLSSIPSFLPSLLLYFRLQQFTCF